MRGETFLYADAVAALVRDHLDRARSGDDVEPLTPRELEVLKLVAEGHTSDEIAELLVISRKTSTATGPTCSRSSACATEFS